jgi:hypothetical protein
MRARYGRANDGASASHESSAWLCDAVAMCEIPGMILRTAVLIVAMALAACSTRDKKPRLPVDAVVGTWASDTMRTDSAARLYRLRMSNDGMAEFTSEFIGRAPMAERGTWDGADSLVRVVVRGDGTGARPTSILFAIRGNSLGLVAFDTVAWGPSGLTLRRR